MARRQPIRARTWKRLHLTLTGIWALLLVPTLLLWQESILWIAFMSLYANVAGHWSAAEGASAAENTEIRRPRRLKPKLIVRPSRRLRAAMRTR